MCRFAAWTGTEKPLSALIDDPPHGLMHQSWAPRLMQEVVLNADGAGFAWYPADGDPRPLHYRTATPIWQDLNLRSMAPRLRAPLFLGVVRSATPGLPVGPSSTPPFVHGRIAFAHNGFLDGFHQHFQAPFQRALADPRFGALTAGGTDTEHLFAFFLSRLGDSQGAPALREALKETLRFAEGLARETGQRAALNLLLSDGESILASRFGVGLLAPTLFIARGASGYEDGLLIASEPLTEDAAWEALPPDTLLTVKDGGHVEREAL